MMEHIIYKTTNSLNNRFYFGMHSTMNIDDGYLGSGRRIKAEVKKYGKENFVKEILEYLPTREALCERETEIVCETLLMDPLCLNLKLGGEGGWHVVNQGNKSSRFSGKMHTSCTKLQMSISQQGKQKGEKNSQYGTFWVTNELKSIKIQKDLLDEYLTAGFKRGRK